MMTDNNQLTKAPAHINVISLAWLKELGITQLYGQDLKHKIVKPDSASQSLSSTSTVNQAIPALSSAPASLQAEAEQVPNTATIADTSLSTDQLIQSKSATSDDPQSLVTVATPPKLGKRAQAVLDAVYKATNVGADDSQDPTLPRTIPSPTFDPACSLEVLNEHIKACVSCGLHKGRQQTVIGSGADVDQVELFVLDLAPGAQEEWQGEAFVGNSRQLLDNMLASIGLSCEKQVFISYLVKCRPQSDSIPHNHEVQTCQAYLLKQIALYQPKVILALGRAAEFLLGVTDGAIDDLRQKDHLFSVSNDVKVPIVPTYHPNYLIINQEDKAKAWEDLLAVKTLLSSAS